MYPFLPQLYGLLRGGVPVRGLLPFSFFSFFSRSFFAFFRCYVPLSLIPSTSHNWPKNNTRDPPLVDTSLFWGHAFSPLFGSILLGGVSSHPTTFELLFHFSVCSSGKIDKTIRYCSRPVLGLPRCYFPRAQVLPADCGLVFFPLPQVFPLLCDFFLFTVLFPLRIGTGWLRGGGFFLVFSSVSGDPLFFGFKKRLLFFSTGLFLNFSDLTYCEVSLDFYSTPSIS